jgi:hypothetical protein
MAKALEQELMQYILQLDDAEKKSVLQMLKTFVKGREGKVSRIGIEEYNQELKEAEAEYERGEYLPHEEFVKQIKKW